MFCLSSCEPVLLRLGLIFTIGEVVRSTKFALFSFPLKGLSKMMISFLCLLVELVLLLVVILGNFAEGFSGEVVMQMLLLSVEPFGDLDSVFVTSSSVSELPDRFNGLGLPGDIAPCKINIIPNNGYHQVRFVLPQIRRHLQLLRLRRVPIPNPWMLQRLFDIQPLFWIHSH